MVRHYGKEAWHGKEGNCKPYTAAGTLGVQHQASSNAAQAPRLEGSTAHPAPRARQGSWRTDSSNHAATDCIPMHWHVGAN